MIYSFIGVIGSGKDVRATRLANIGAARVDFKDGLLDLASDIAGYDVRLEYEWFKKNIVGVKRPPNKFQEAFVFTDRRQIMNENPDVMTGRRLLQRLGTEGMRKRDEDYWVNQYTSRVRDILARGRAVATADCRFPNEVLAIQRLDSKAQFVFCDYRSERYDPTSNHPSEHLAQRLLAMGLKHEQIIEKQHFFDAFK